MARALEDGGVLLLMATDLALPHWLTRRAKGPLSRYTVDLPPEKVIAAPLTGFAYRAAMRLAGPHKAWPHLWAAKRTAAAVLPKLKRQKPDIVFGLDTGAVELFEAFDTASPRPKLVLEQCVAPRTAQLKMLERLAPYFPAETYEARKAYTLAHKEREEREWQMADVIVVPSDFVREELEAAGCDPAKLRLVPYGYTPPDESASSRKRGAQLPLKGLFVGGVDHRKGVHDLAAVAEAFRGRIEIDVYGKYIAPESDIAEWGRTLTLHGPRPFSEIVEAYRQSDFLLLPSYLEGSALVVYEAMAHGLPAIVTRETGSIVTDGVDGFLIEAGDREALARTLQRLADDPTQLGPMSEAARRAAGEVSDETYSDRLMKAILS